MASSNKYSGEVIVEGSKVIFKNFSIEDAVILAEFKAAQDSVDNISDFAFSVLDIGVRTASLRSNTAGAEKIEASINQANKSIGDSAKAVEEALKGQIKGLVAEDGALIRGIQSIVDSYQDEVEELTSGEDSELRKAMIKLLREAKDDIAKDVRQTVESQRKMLGELLDPSNSTSPLRSLAQSIQGVATSINDMKHEAEVDIAVAEVVETGTTGGLDYEKIAINALQHVASMAGDDCEHTGGFTGRVPRSKMGDAVVEVKVGGKVFGRMVAEAKNSPLTKKAWEAEAKGSRTNRGASGFIGLCKHPSDMPNNSKIMILDPQGIVVQFNPELEDPTFITLIYNIVKMNTLNNAGNLEGLDIAELNINLQEAIRELEGFDELIKTASSIENAGKKVKKQAADIRDGVQKRIEAVQEAIRQEFDSLVLEADNQPLALEE